VEILKPGEEKTIEYFYDFFIAPKRQKSETNRVLACWVLQQIVRK